MRKFWRIVTIDMTDDFIMTLPTDDIIMVLSTDHSIIIPTVKKEEGYALREREVSQAW